MARGRSVPSIATAIEKGFITVDAPAAPAPDPTVLRLLTLAQRMADRCVRGKFGLALENDARAALELWEELPSEIRELL